MIVIPDEELEQILWRATRGCHYESAFLSSSKYAQRVIEEDVPKLIMIIRKLQEETRDKFIGIPEGEQNE